MTAVVSNSVISISEFRQNLAHVLKLLQSDESGIKFLGSHRKPQAVLMSIDEFNSRSQSNSIDLATVVRKRDTLLRIAKSYGIQKVGVFGSVARVQQSPSSDLDLAIDSQKGLSTLDMTAFALDAENIFDCKVDVISLGGLKADRHSEILKELVFL
jgi:predicted nucleotidyltransferase